MPTRPRFVWLLALSGLTLLTCLFAGCGEDRAATAPPPRNVRSLVVTASPGKAASEYTAEIRSRFETDLAFQVGGKLISRVVDVGTVVHKGDVLAKLDETDQRVSVQGALAAVNAAQAEVLHARSEEGRYRDLLERGLTTRAAHMAQQTTVKTGQSKLEQTQADLKLSEQKLRYTVLRADADGVVTAVMAEVGAVVSAGQRVLTVARPDELEAVFDLPDSQVGDIRDSASARVTLFSDPSHASYAARVREISPSADPVTRTYRIKTSIPNAPPNLRLGMNVVVTLDRMSAGPEITVPATALFQQNREPAVWVVKHDRTLELRKVNVARYDSDRVLIAQGLRAGERVVTAGVHRLAAGEQIRLATGDRQ